MNVELQAPGCIPVCLGLQTRVGGGGGRGDGAGDKPDSKGRKYPPHNLVPPHRARIVPV
jgi:hypothetical protein